MADSSKIAQWVENYAQNNHKQIEITTIDNPGWSLRVNLDNDESKNEKIILVDLEKTEHDWYCCRTENKKFKGSGGPYNLVDMFFVFRQFINSENIKERPCLLLNLSDPIMWLQNWYFSQCDEDWEHGYGVSIKTNEKGWYVRIDLIETESEDINLDLKMLQHSDSNWFSYCVKDSIFEASCSPFNLIKVITAFKDLVESPEMNR